jgi:hypothetical protein
MYARQIGKRKKRDDEELELPFPESPYGLPAFGGDGNPNGIMPVYNMPPSMLNGDRDMSRMGNHDTMSKAIPMQGMQRGQNYGPVSQISIQYTAADGTMYNMGVMTPDGNKAKALNNVLAGLYGLMMAEGKYAKGKGDAYSSYSGARGGRGKGASYGGRGSYAGGSSYAGGKGGSSGSGGK